MVVVVVVVVMVVLAVGGLVTIVSYSCIEAGVDRVRVGMGDMDMQCGRGPGLGWEVGERTLDRKIGILMVWCCVGSGWSFSNQFLQ
ncbi:hypothetical protein F5X96DRAFT_661545, partial [Biscogniauxia mediterranea]